MASLRAAGCTVRVLASDYRSASAGDAPEDEDVHRCLGWYWKEHRFPQLGLRARARLERSNAAMLRSHLEDFAPDVVMWWPMGGMSLGLIEQIHRARIPAVGYVADDWMVYGPEVDQWIATWCRRPSLSRVAELITRVPASVDLSSAAEWHFISDETRRRATDAIGSLPLSEVTHAGIDPGMFAPAVPPPWNWRLLYLGRLDERKGIDVAIRALADLPAEATLVVHGEGDDGYAARLRQLVTQLGLDGRVRFGSSSHGGVRDAYVRADVVVFPVTWAEPWGLVPLEAMSVGRPVVATGTGGSGEYLRDGRNCLLFEPGDHRELAAAIRRLAADARLRDRLQEGGRETAAALTAERCDARLTAAVRQAANRLGAREMGGR